MKLQSMVAYVKEQCKNMPENGQIDTLFKIYNYANLLSLNLEKWMFVACDDNGNVLDLQDYIDEEGIIIDSLGFNKHQQAKSRLIFEGFELDFKTSNLLKINDIVNQMRFYKNGYITINSKAISTIKDLVTYNQTITEQAVKNYGL